MNEDLKSKVIDVIDSLIPKGQNSLGLREADMVYGINKAKEAVEKLFAEISTQDCISRQPVLDAIDEIESEVADGDGFQYEKWKQYFCDLPSADIDLSDYSDRLWRNAYEQGKADAEPRWIPVSERNPKGLGEYLVTWETWAVKKARYITIAWYMPDRLGSPTGEWLLPEPFRSGYPDPTVVAWMPCPNAWRVGAE